MSSGKILKVEVAEFDEIKKGFDDIATSAAAATKAIDPIRKGFESTAAATKEIAKLTTKYETELKKLKTQIDNITASINKGKSAKQKEAEAIKKANAEKKRELELNKQTLKGRLAINAKNIADAKKLEAAAIKEVNEARKKELALNAQTLKGRMALNAEAEKKAMKQLNAAIKETEKKERELLSAKKALDTQRQKGLAAMAKEQHEAKKLIGTYAGLQQSLQRNIVKYQNLTLKKQQNTAAGKKLKAQIIAEQKELGRVNKSMGTGVKRSGGLASSFKRLTISLRNLAIAYLGFQTLIRGFQDIFKVTKILDSITFAQEKVIKSQTEFAQTQQWLSKIISDYGLDLVTVTNRYTKFRAATISSNLTAIQTQKIFGSMSKAAATLGLKTDELQGVYLALEQMISKGLVTTEELRRQLGERLPGAFNIMATSLGKTTLELNKMLRAGKVVSEEVLPGFADAVEEAYGIKSVQFVDTLVAAQNRLRTSWIELIRIFNAAGSIKGFLNTLSGMIGTIGKNIEVFKTLGKIIVGLTGVTLTYLGVKRLLNTQIFKNIAGIISGTIAFTRQTVATVRQTAAIGSLTVAQRLYTLGSKAATIATKALKWAFTSTGIGAIITGFATLAAILLPIIFRTKELSDATLELSDRISKEKAKIDLLFGSLQNAKRGGEEWKTLKQEINRTYSEYLPNLIDEKTSYEDIAKALEEVNKQTLLKIHLGEKDNAIADASDSKNAQFKKTYDELSDAMEDWGFSMLEIKIARGTLMDITERAAKGEVLSQEEIFKAINKTLDKTKALTEHQLALEKVYGKNPRLPYYKVAESIQETIRITEDYNEVLETQNELYKQLLIDMKMLSPEEEFNKIKKEISNAEMAFTHFFTASSVVEKKYWAERVKNIAGDAKTFTEYLWQKQEDYKNKKNVIAYIERQITALENKELIERLNNSKKLFDEYENLKEGTGTRTNLMAFNPEIFSNGIKNYKDFLNKLLVADSEYLKKVLDITELSISQRTAIELELSKLSKGAGGGDKDSTLKNLRNQQKAELELLDKQQQDQLDLHMWLFEQNGATEDEYNRELLRKRQEMGQNLIKQEIINQGVLLNHSKSDADEKLKIAAKIAELQKKLQENLTNFNIAEYKRDAAAYKKEQEYKLKLAIESNKTQTEKEISLSIFRGAEKLMALSKEWKDGEIGWGKYNKRREEIEYETSRNILMDQVKGLGKKYALAEGDKIEQQRIAAEIMKLGEDLDFQKIDREKRTNEAIKENREAVMNASIELVNTLFAAQQASFDAQLMRAAEVRDFQVALAGSNTEERIKAERKFEKEDLKIRQKQAKAQKAQAIFNVITNTAVGITAALTSFIPNIPLAILIGAIGAIQLGVIAATPVPKLAEGGIADGLTIVGDKKGDSSLTKAGGSELITTPDGKSFLSPMFPTLMDLPAGTEVKPHDETQMILARGAQKSAYERIDMGTSEKYLKDIRDKGDVTYVDGYKIVSRKNFSGRYRCS